MLKFRIGSMDVFFASFDEPWAADFFADLQGKAPHAQWVRGVVGHDNMIKECARRSATRRFLTVDADNIVNPEILHHVLDDRDMEDVVFSFRGHNTLNGLEYGNGGPMCWSRSTAQSMRTHDAAEDERSQVDFCWATRTYLVDAVGSTVHVTGTPYHAFRAGYREAVKMTLVDGQKKSDLAEVKDCSWHGNWSRLMMWASVGLDVTHGAWAIYGVRKALHDIWLGDVQVGQINDYAWFTQYWKQLSTVDPHSAAITLGAELNHKFDLGIQDLSPEASRWVKSIYVNPTSSGFMMDYSQMAIGAQHQLAA